MTLKSSESEFPRDPCQPLFEEIIESEQRYHQLFETNKAVKLIIDPSDGQIIKANESACSYYGYSKERFETLYITDINTLSPNEVEKEMARAQKKEALVFSFSHKLANGEIRDVEVYSGPFQYQNKTLLFSIVHDVTEKNLAARKLEIDTKNLYSIFNSVPNILILLNQESRVEMLNHQAASFVGKEESEVLGKLGGDLLECLNSFEGQGCGQNSDCASCPVRNTVQATLETSQCFSDVECQMTFLRNGQEKLFNFLISTSILDFNNEKKVLLSLSDVAVLREKEKEISFQAYLLNQIQDQVIVTDLAGKIIYENDASSKVNHKSKEALTGNIVTISADSPSRGVMQKEIIENTVKNGEWQGEISGYNKSGDEVIMNFRTKLLKDNLGNATAIMGVSTDITQQKLIAKQLEQSQKMEVMGTLAGGIAHDFNNILAPILGYSEILLEEIPAENQTVRNNLEQIHISAMRASELVKQILTFSRQKDTEFKPIKAQIILKEAVKLISSTVPKNIVIKQDIDDSCPAINADATQIHQIIMNLLTNAYHAIGDIDGKITVTYRQKKELPQEVIENNGFISDFVCLEVADTGSGISEEILNQIFDPFFTTKEQGKGTGMGLSVAHGIVKKMNGHISINSEPGRNTLFSLYFPIDPGIKNSTEIRDNNDLPKGEEHILLVDDEEQILDMQKRVLERLGYRVSQKNSPLDALEAFRNAPYIFDLVITDMSMPVMSGDKLAKQLLELRPELPIILNTGFSEKLTQSSAKEMGFREILMKPIIRKELAETIRKVLDRNNIDVA